MYKSKLWAYIGLNADRKRFREWIQDWLVNKETREMTAVSSEDTYIFHEGFTRLGTGLKRVAPCGKLPRTCSNSIAPDIIYCPGIFNTYALRPRSDIFSDRILVVKAGTSSSTKWLLITKCTFTTYQVGSFQPIIGSPSIPTIRRAPGGRHLQCYIFW